MVLRGRGGGGQVPVLLGHEAAQLAGHGAALLLPPLSAGCGLQLITPPTYFPKVDSLSARFAVTGQPVTITTTMALIFILI